MAKRLPSEFSVRDARLCQERLERKFSAEREVRAWVRFVPISERSRQRATYRNSSQRNMAKNID